MVSSTPVVSRPSVARRVSAAEPRLVTAGLETCGVDDTMCCFALKTETWVNDPDGAPWEWYVKTGDADQMTNTVLSEGERDTCCSPAAISESVSIGSGPCSSAT